MVETVAQAAVLINNLKIESMRTILQLQDYGFVYLGTNRNGTETFVSPNDIVVKSYVNGYVRRHSGYFSRRYDGQPSIWQMNLTRKVKYGPKKWQHSTERIMIPTHEGRYQRILDWYLNTKTR